MNVHIFKNHQILFYTNTKDFQLCNMKISGCVVLQLASEKFVLCILCKNLSLWLVPRNHHFSAFHCYFQFVFDTFKHNVAIENSSTRSYTVSCIKMRLGQEISINHILHQKTGFSINNQAVQSKLRCYTLLGNLN